MSTPEYLDGTTDHQKHMQDSLNKELAGFLWHLPISRAYVDRVVRVNLLRGNRNKTEWEVVTDMRTAPPRIQILPYRLPNVRNS